MLGQIHPFLIDKHKQKRIAAGHRVAVNRELAALSAMFNRCMEWGKFEGVHPVRKVERLDEPLSRLRFLSDEEEQKLVNECQEPLRSIVLLGIYAGLRINAEALTLKKQSAAAYSKNGETQTIPLHSKLVDPQRRFLESGEGGLLFSNQAGGLILSVRSAFTNACERANLSGVTPHTFRHTFAPRLGMKGVNDITLQALERWKEPKMIRRYAHLSQEHLADAIEQIGSEVPTRVTTQKTVAS